MLSSRIHLFRLFGLPSPDYTMIVWTMGPAVGCGGPRTLHGTARFDSLTCMVGDRWPLHGTARLDSLTCTGQQRSRELSVGIATYGPRNPVPPTLATRGSLLRGAWEPRVQTAPQEPKSPMPHFARGEGARAREVPCHLVNVVIVAKEQGGQHPTASPTASGMHFGGAQARRAAMGNGTKRHRATRDAEAGQG